MSNSFADQLLKAGLVSEDDISKAEAQKQQKAAKRKAQRAAKKHPAQKQKPVVPKGDGTVANSAASKMLGTTQDIADKQQKKKQQQVYVEQRRVMNIKINELLKDAAVEDPDGDIKFSYVYDAKVRHTYVSEAQQKKLASAEYALTVVKAKTKLIPATLIESLKAVDPERFVHIVKEEASDKDDPYAGFEVPDDLTW